MRGVPPLPPDAHDHARCGGFEPLYDVEAGLADLARARRLRDHVTRATTELADRMAHRLEAHFSGEELETVGRALVIVAASTGALAADAPTIQPVTLVNLVGFAGQRLVVDARAAEGERQP